jgi:hypothetical protein
VSVTSLESLLATSPWVLGAVVVSLALIKTVDRILLCREALRDTKPEDRAQILRELRMLYAEHAWPGKAGRR